ncbi:hypothetical protein CDL15_Pgr001236 [Punica granatum]|uniref:Peptidase C14 caspase domain-containing protein n=1 Tax=Punica granatum TaxID=22663 RepID=A0A218WM78_PUNGR|nr:hypothetical protein CDL15_Pgr001236 [Punica granatum]
MEKGKKRLAVLVGCNYPNTQYELHGCINDVLAMREVLVKRFGFDPQNVELLMDAPGSPVLPTGTNVKAALDRMVDRAEAGDVLFFHYSGHGTRIPRPRHKLPLWQDEAIVPCDFNLITDMDFRHMVNRLPKGSSFTILSDSCHSGGLIDKEKEQIGPYTALCDGGASLSHAPRTIPFNSLLHHLSSLTKINTSDIGTHLLECFGSEASLRFRRTLEELDAPIDLPVKPDEGILLSGCQAEETSADMSPSAAAAGGAGKAYGAFSNAVQIVLRENAGRRLSNREVVAAARAVLRAQGFAQHPCLYCSDENADAPFLWRPEPAEE